MNRSSPQVLMPTDNGRDVIIDDDRNKIIVGSGGRAEEIVEQAKASINDVLQSSTAQIRGAVENMKDTIKSCEAKISLNEEIQVIVKPDQVIFSIKRSFEMLKDK